MEVCQKCGIFLEEHNSHSHLVRTGYCPTMFPFIKYKKMALCPFCYKKQLRADNWEKMLAIIGLGIVLFLMAHWFFLLFAW